MSKLRPATLALLLLAVSAVLVCLLATTVNATRPVPFAGERRWIDKVFVATQTPDTREQAVQILERIALGTPVGLVSIAGVQATDVALLWLTNASVRAYAFRRLGETGLARVEAFLAAISPAELGDDTTGQVWPSARVAYWDCRVRRLSSGEATALLETLVSEKQDAGATGSVQWWAANQLCDRGSSGSLPPIRASIESMYSGKRGDEEIRFCEVRVRILSGSQTRLQALIAALWGVDDFEDFRVKRWAIDGLLTMRSPDANAALLKYANDAASSLPWYLLDDIKESLRQRGIGN